MTRTAEAWTLADVPDQTGRTVVVTGPSVGGLGHHTALELARRGARVVLAGRTPAKLEETEDAVRAEVPAAELERLVVDLSSLASVRRAAAEAEALGPIHVLVNNAGVMGTKRRRTEDDLDLQVATNHFGPFLLTGLLLPQLVAAGSDGPESTPARVVTVSSIFQHFVTRPPLDDPHRRPRGIYRKWHVYGQSKLANMLFTAELDHRCREAGLPVTALGAHPGFAGTHLAANGQYGRARGGIATVVDAAIRAVSQPAAAGAWPTLMAATADLPGATFVGPSGLAELGGVPRVTSGSAQSKDPDLGRRLWELSERTTGIEYP